MDEQWWVFDPAPGLLVWARLRVREDGVCEVMDSTGLVLRFAEESMARAHLLDQAYRAYDGLDEEDALELGFSLDHVAPPEGKDDEERLRAMTQKLDGRS